MHTHQTASTLTSKGNISLVFFHPASQLLLFLVSSAWLHDRHSDFHTQGSLHNKQRTTKTASWQTCKLTAHWKNMWEIPEQSTRQRSRSNPLLTCLRPFRSKSHFSLHVFLFSLVLHLTISPIPIFCLISNFLQYQPTRFNPCNQNLPTFLRNLQILPRSFHRKLPTGHLKICKILTAFLRGFGGWAWFKYLTTTGASKYHTVLWLLVFRILFMPYACSNYCSTRLYSNPVCVILIVWRTNVSSLCLFVS